MRDLNYELKQLCQRNRDGSFATRANREAMLSRVADQLHELGYRHMTAQSLKPKHVERLVAQWQAEQLAAGTIKNRMAALRWWAEKIGKPSVLARDNAGHGIAERCHVTNVSKANELDAGQLAAISDPYTVLSLRLQEAFGLRREESIKLCPAWADRGEILQLKASWTKGGRERSIPIRTPEQRVLLEDVKQLAGAGSLIPARMSYKDQLNRFKAQTAKAGITHVHGLRHGYAQNRYQQLTGWKAPAAGGPTTKQLTAEQKAIDREARRAISRELGHEREGVTAVYLGR